MRKPRTRHFPFLAALAGCLLASGLAGCHKEKPAPSIDDLSAALERSAEKALPAPSLVDAQIEVTAKPEETAARTAEIEHLFEAAGGSGIASVDAEGRTSVLGTIPGDNLAAFKALLRHENATLPSKPGGTSLTVEVLITNPTPAPASPAP